MSIQQIPNNNNNDNTKCVYLPDLFASNTFKEENKY